MRKPSFISVSPEETERVRQFISTAISEDADKKWNGYRQRRRAQIIWFSLQGWTASKITRELKISEQTVWKWRRIYKQKGIEWLQGKYRSSKL